VPLARSGGKPGEKLRRLEKAYANAERAQLPAPVPLSMLG
jgi:hypothetical protein